MSSIGFAVFGSPVRFECLSNGIIQEMDWDSLFYLSGPCQEILFEEGQTYYLIDQIKDNENSITSWIIIKVEFARSFSEDRAGGFVGAAIAFTGFPNGSNMVIGLNALFNMVLQEIDPVTRKFKSAKKEYWKCKLPNLENAKQLLIESPVIYQQNYHSDLRAVIQLNSFDESLGSLIQNIILNPSLNSYGRILLTTNNFFAKKLTQYGFVQITPIDAYNYGNLISLVSEQSKLLSENRKTLEGLSQQVGDLKSESDKVFSDLNKLKKEKTDLESEYKALSEKNSQLGSKHTQLNSEMSQKITKIFQENSDFFGEIIHKKTKEIISQKDYIIEDLEGRILRLKKRISIISLILGVFLFISISVFAWYAIYKLQIFKKESQAVPNATIFELPKDAIEDPLDINMWEQRRGLIQVYLAYLDTVNRDSVDLSPFLSRAWDPREVLIPDKTIEGSIKNLKNIQNVIRRFEVADSWRFSCKDYCDAEFKDPMGKYIDPMINKRLSERYFLLDNLDRKQIVYEEFNFPRNQPDSLLKTYLQNDRNVYSKAAYPFSINQPDTLLITHFRWMVNQTAGQDILHSDIKKIKLPLVKK
jgi:hypothetical protein